MTINVITYYRDGGDGGGSITLYNTLEELRAEEFHADNYDSPEEAEAAFQACVAESDPYENGEIGTQTLEVEQAPDGTLRLAKYVWLHYGQ